MIDSKTLAQLETFISKNPKTIEPSLPLTEENLKNITQSNLTESNLARHNKEQEETKIREQSAKTLQEQSTYCTIS